MHHKSHYTPDIPSSVCELWMCVFSCGHRSPPPLLTGLWRERVNWHGATQRPAWRSTRWCRTGWMRSYSGSSWPRSGTDCLGSGYGSEPHHTLCGATGGLTWGRQWEGRGFTHERLSPGAKEFKKGGRVTSVVNMTVFIKCLTKKERLIVRYIRNITR